jgi:hypothetical protein
MQPMCTQGLCCQCLPQHRTLHGNIPDLRCRCACGPRCMQGLGMSSAQIAKCLKGNPRLCEPSSLPTLRESCWLLSYRTMCRYNGWLADGRRHALRGWQPACKHQVIGNGLHGVAIISNNSSQALQ